MENAVPKIEAIFAQALEKRSGSERDAFVQRQCGSDAALLQEVQSLLRAHDTAGDFLNPPISPQSFFHQLENVETSAPGIQNPASQARIFAANMAGCTAEEIDAQLAALPIETRKETRERIEAVQRVRLLQPGDNAVKTASEIVPDIPGFKIERKLGEGSSGTVYAAHDQKLKRKVALKVLTRDADGAVRRRIMEEARHAAALNDPAVATIYSVLDETDPPALVMELIEGYPLDLFTKELNPIQKARLLREVVRGLASAHARGMIHRDLKPDNVIVGPDLRPRILDFGLALTFEEASRQRLGFAGTPLYASPEQVQGKTLSAASDIFSFGSLMFKVLTGRPPFEGSTTLQVLEAIATTAPPFPREVALGIPADLQAICLACLAWDPADRPTASEIHLELGRFLIGEPVRLKPKLYDDLLRRSVSEYSSQAQVWMSQSIISPEERDALEVVHRRLLAEEDHWIIDARRITLLQILLSGGSWLTVVAIVLMVWMMRDELGVPWRWLLPGVFSATLLSAGILAYRVRENFAAATFLAGATLAIAPCTLTLLAEIGLFSAPIQSTVQLFPNVFTNQQVLAASGITLLVSSACLWRLKMTGFAWTTAMLTTATYISFLLQANWLEQKIEIKALWCLPLVLMESVSLALESKGLVRWNTPFHLIAAAALVGCLDLMAWNGPTLRLCGLDASRWSYLDETRQISFSFVVNGVLFLILARVTARAASLNLRRAGVWLEMLALVHALSALFANAMNHRNDPGVRTDVFLYLAVAAAFLLLATLYSRWRLLVGGLLGVGLGSYLLIDLGIVQRLPFVTGLGLAGVTVALGTYLYVRRRSQLRGKPGSNFCTDPKLNYEKHH